MRGVEGCCSPNFVPESKNAKPHTFMGGGGAECFIKLLVNTEEGKPKNTCFPVKLLKVNVGKFSYVKIRRSINFALICNISFIRVE